MCSPIQISYLNSKAVLALPKMAHSAQTHKIISLFESFGAFYIYVSEGDSPKLYVMDEIISSFLGEYAFFIILKI